MYINLELLKATNSTLHRKVILQLGDLQGISQIDPADFSDSTAQELHAWMRSMRAILAAKRGEVPPVAPASSTFEQLPPPAAEPAEVLGTLPDGTKQLSLNVAPTNKNSKEQVKDWLRRTREVTGKYLRPQASFGSKFI